MAIVRIMLTYTIFVSTLILFNIVGSLASNNTEAKVLSKQNDKTPSTNLSCSNDKDCNGHGKCYENSTGCECDNGWITFPNESQPIGYCNYSKRSKKTAFFLSLFLGAFGIDWFYLSKSALAYILIGILKLLLGSVCLSAWPLTYYGPKLEQSESEKMKLRAVNTFFTLGIFAWWVVDWARILVNKFSDGNGIELIPW